jgi:hypothetical protein
LDTLIDSVSQFSERPFSKKLDEPENILLKRGESMRNPFTESCIKQLLTMGVLVITAMTASCSTAVLLKSHENSFILSDDRSIIFGKVDFVHNGLTIGFKGKSRLTHHISRFNSYEELNRSPLKAGEYAFVITSDNDDGYFAYVLPPGKYYFVEFVYSGDLPPFFTGIRTYHSIMGWTMIKPFVITFDVPPNSAVYIGTIRHEFIIPENGGGRAAAAITPDFNTTLAFFQTQIGKGGGRAAAAITIVNDFGNAKKWFLKSREKLDGYVVESIAQVQ